MGRSPCCKPDANIKKGPWTTEEDKKLVDYIEKHGAGNWRQLPKEAGLNRCGKSCRLRWANYLRPDIKRGSFSDEEERLIIYLHSVLGNKWSAIAARIPGRTDNEIKNYWNTHIRKRLLKMGIDPVTHMPRTDLNLLANLPILLAANANFNNLATNPVMMNNALQLPKLQLLQTLVQAMSNNISSSPNLFGPSILNGSLGHHDLNPMLSGSTNLGLQNQPDNLQTALDEKLNYASCDSTKFAGESSTTTSLTANSAPSLVTVSTPESFTGVEKAQDRASSSSSTPRSTPFEPWRELTLDDLDCDLGWKDILEQISWPNTL